MKYIAVIAAALVLAMPSYSAPVKTLANLKTALAAESKVALDSSYCAMLAQNKKNYGVASLMKAVNASAAVHVKKINKAIADLGGKGASILPGLPPSEKSVDKVLASVMSQLNQLVNKQYPVYLKVAAQEGARSANTAFGASSVTDKNLISLITPVVKNKKVWNTAKAYFVCPRCGYVVTKITFKTCPICAEPRDEFKQVK